ncbi:MAG TPA: carbon monoxide dehydrogenase subunit G [Afifellaceae bacterium]|nr:carbon monoxide dehydrogenase subunit G [Afifellaceae bacterium]
MDLSGEYRIPTSRGRVWEMLNDPDVLRVCIPGCQELEQTADNAFSAKVTTKVGPVKATFNGNVTLENIKPPEGYTITGEGKGGVAGFASGGADVHLAEDGAETLLTYKAHAKVGGKLAQLGSRLLDSTARKLADQFFSKFAEMAGGAPAAAPQEEGAIAGALHKVEETVSEAAHQVSETAHMAEEALERQAARGVLGGPLVWGLLAIAAIVLFYIIAT